MSLFIQDSKTNEKVKVKVTPAMLMNEVLQEYCKVKGVEKDRATLLHKNKPVDLSAPFRLTGLANNATLTVGQRASTAVPILTVALQLENGARVQAKVQVNNTLWQVLLGFEAQDSALNLTKLMQHEPAPERKGLLRLTGGKEGPLGWMQPVLTLLNKQFSTVEDLSNTSLQSLGLTSGNCLIRVGHTWTPLTAPPTVSAAPATLLAPPVATAKPEEAKPEAKTQQKGNDNQEGNDNNNNNNNNNDVAEFAKPEAVNRPAKSQKTLEEEVQVTATVPADRNVVVFEPNDAPFNPAKFDIPDDFYNLSPSDMAALKNSDGKEEFLMTREFREKKAIANYVKFAKTNIRVRFPDRYELQATFLSTEGTLHLIDFLRDFLVDDQREFVLYTTPPKQNLENASWLSQKLVPAAVVYFAWSDRKEKDEYLKPEAKANATLLAKTTAHLSTFSNQTPLDFTVLITSTNAVASASEKGKEEGGATATATAAKKKPGVPSWLKLKK